MRNIREELVSMRDSENRNFLKKLIPTVSEERILGIRTPILRKYAKELYNTRKAPVEDFLRDLPHFYFDENNLHAFLIEQVRDYQRAMELTEAFLPFIDNWATCDSFSPKVFKKYPDEIYERILEWIESEKPYTRRFAVGLLLSWYLDEHFDSRHLLLAAGADSDEYYVKMMIAWYFSTALTKQYDAAIAFFTERRLDKWTHNKALQKAVESRRISEEKKIYFKSLKIKE